MYLIKRVYKTVWGASIKSFEFGNKMGSIVKTTIIGQIVHTEIRAMGITPYHSQSAQYSEKRSGRYGDMMVEQSTELTIGFAGKVFDKEAAS